MIRPLALALLLALAACHRPAAGPRASAAWVRLPAVPGLPGAAYLTLAGGRRAERLVKVESALAGRVEMHETMAGAGGMSGMAPLTWVDVPAGETVRFRPGGRHLMLFAIDPSVRPGTAIPLRLGFTSGRTAEAEAKTVPAGGDAPY